MVIDDAALETKLLIVHKLIESIEISGKSFQFKVGFIVSSFWNLFSIVFLKDQRLFTSLFVRSLKEFHWLQIFENCFIFRYKKILTSSVVLQKVNNCGENEFSVFFSLHSRFSSLSFYFYNFFICWIGAGEKNYWGKIKSRLINVSCNWKRRLSRLTQHHAANASHSQETFCKSFVWGSVYCLKLVTGDYTQ